ncbi:MAG: hypothetical protein JKY55_13640 [Aliivibrio sp.]|uniref:hypothetical protein n=1 Tax=Aliivibrio sp. TaxID=1872443 RepID=UPI001A413382|nr:hypothetical protein [Aliivibrio sp.]
MNILINRLIIILSVVLLYLPLTSCNSGGGDSSSPSSPITTPQYDEVSQQEIEAMAESSMAHIDVQDGFTFETQRIVTVHLNFSSIQYDTQIAIYSSFDTSSDTPIHLIEQGTLNQSTHYRTLLSVPSSSNKLFISINQDLVSPSELAIATDNTAHFFFN